MKKLILFGIAIISTSTVLRAASPAFENFKPGVFVRSGNTIGISANATNAAGETLATQEGIAAGSVPVAASALTGTANVNTTGNAAGATNVYGAPAFNAVNVTNLPILAPADPSVTPVPDIYVLTSYGSNNITEGDFIKYINQIYTNGYLAYGWKGVQADAGWAARDGSGKLIVNPNTFTNDLKYICDYAHARGVKIGVYYSIVTNAGYNPFGQVNMHTNMLADIQVLATNGVDWIKIDSYTSDAVDTSQQPIRFWNAVANTGANIHRQETIGNYGNTVGQYAGTPAIISGLNSAYVAFGLPDTYAPRNFTNAFAHFLKSLPAKHLVGPSFKLEGTGWLWTGLNNQYPYPDHCYVDMALMTAERLVLTPDVNSYSLTNKALWDLFQASPVTVADIVITNGADLVCSKIIGNKTLGVRLVCFINSAATNKTTTYNLRDLGFPNNAPVTYYSPWFGNSLEGWATNTISVTVTATNTLLYKMMWGYQSQIPAAGITYLSDLEWASTCNIPRGANITDYALMLSKDYRSGDPTSPLIIGSTTYTKGFGAGAYWMGSTNPTWEINIGTTTTNAYLSLAFGKQQAWNGGNAGVRLTIYTNGVTSTVSGFVTNNASQATNFVVPLAGVTKVGFLVETNGAGACQAVLGDCMVVEPLIKTTPISAPQFNGSAAGLTNVAEEIIRFESLPIENYTRLSSASQGPSPFLWRNGLAAAGNATCHAWFTVPRWATNATYTMMIAASGISTWTNFIEPIYTPVGVGQVYNAGGVNTSNEVMTIGVANTASNFSFSVKFPATNCFKVFGFKALAATNTSATRYFGPYIEARYQ